MNKSDFYRIYIPAIIDAFINENSWRQYHVKGPEYYLKVAEDQILEIERYIDENSGKDDFLDRVAYYFDAKSHGFTSINGIPLEEYKNILQEKMIELKKMYGFS